MIFTRWSHLYEESGKLMSKLQELVAVVGPERCIESIESLLATFDKVCIYGAGGNGRKALQYFIDRGIRVVAFGDSNPQKIGTSIQNIPVLPLADIHALEVPVVIASGWARDIAQSLYDNNVTRFYDFTNITYLYTQNGLSHSVWEEHFDSRLLFRDAKKIDSIFSEIRDEFSLKTLKGLLCYRLTMNPLYLEIALYEQYLSPDVPPHKGMVIADCGAWEGDSTLRYAEFLDYDCTVHAFEPTRASFKKLLLLSASEKTRGSIVAHNFAIGDSIGEVRFDTSSNSSMAFNLSQSGNEVVKCITIDAIFQNKPLNILKMDIEGNESDALHGARETIKKYKPDLHICVYHKYSDFYEIPLLIDSIQPGYKWFFGHHNQHLHETVLYTHFVQQ